MAKRKGKSRKQANPADLSALCGTLQPAIASNLTAVCGGGATLSAAYGAYSSTCQAAKGVQVAPLPSASAGFGSGSGSGSGSGGSGTST